MQCPDGRNVLIQRQKTTLGHLATWGAVGVGAYVSGGLAAGVAGLTVSQLATCSEIGFQFWQNRKSMPEQPFITHSYLGFLKIDAGLDRLKRATKDSKNMEAVEACEGLQDPASWHRLVEIKNGNLTFSRENELARKCLSHAKICGKGNAPVEDLNVDRWNPFASVEMCSPGFSVGGKHLDDLDEEADRVAEQIEQELMRAEDVDATNLDAELTSLIVGDLTIPKEMPIPKIPIVPSLNVNLGSKFTLDTMTPRKRDDEEMSDMDEEIIDMSNGGEGREVIAAIEDSEVDFEELPAVSPKGDLEVVKMARPEDSETVKAVGEVLQGCIRSLPGQGNKLSGGQINWCISRACNTKKQLAICDALSSKPREVTECKDRCCLEGCGKFGTKPSCVRACVQHYKKPK